MTENPDTKCGFVCVLGAPNVGKSTLVNALTGAKISIVSPKEQTTRTRIRGILMQGSAQIILVDTPGIFMPKKRLERAMVSSAWDEEESADLTLFLVDVTKKWDDRAENIFNKLKKSRRKSALVLNKTDLVRPAALLELIDTISKKTAGFFDTVFMVSAKTKEGFDKLLSYLEKNMPLSPYMFPEDQVSDMPMRLMAAEITREGLFYNLRQELPYSSTVETEEWEEKEDGSIRIKQTVFVERDSQRQIVLGKKGAMIKKIGERARKDMAEAFGRTVHLFLFVKVRENWQEDPARYSPWGLDFYAKR